MASIEPSSLPENALLGQYSREGAFTDCYVTDVAGQVSHERFVQAFYTTPLFKLERLILKWTVSKPSTDAEVVLMASGANDRFAAWRVEARSEDQLLLADFTGRTRSWLMVAPVETDRGPGTRLYFGSAVVPATNRVTARSKRGLAFSALLRFHKAYSLALLYAARKRLLRHPP